MAIQTPNYYCAEWLGLTPQWGGDGRAVRPDSRGREGPGGSRVGDGRMMPALACEHKGFIRLDGQHFDADGVAVMKVVLVSEFHSAGDLYDVLRVALGGVRA